MYIYICIYIYMYIYMYIYIWHFCFYLGMFSNMGNFVQAIIHYPNMSRGWKITEIEPTLGTFGSRRRSCPILGLHIGLPKCFTSCIAITKKKSRTHFSDLTSLTHFFHSLLTGILGLYILRKLVFYWNWEPRLLSLSLQCLHQLIGLLLSPAGIARLGGRAEDRGRSGTGRDFGGVEKSWKLGGLTQNLMISDALRLSRVFRTFSENGHMKHIFHVEDLPAEPSQRPHQRTAQCLRRLRWFWWWNQPTVKVCALSIKIARTPWKSHWDPMFDPHVWWWRSIFFFPIQSPRNSSCFMVNSCKNDRNYRTNAIWWWFRHRFFIIFPSFSPPLFPSSKKRRRLKKGPTSSLWYSTS